MTYHHNHNKLNSRIKVNKEKTRVIKFKIKVLCGINSYLIMQLNLEQVLKEGKINRLKSNMKISNLVGRI